MQADPDPFAAIYPGGRRAAVSLTYDDGLTQHLDHVLPHLDAYGLRGTFYVPTRTANRRAWPARGRDWRRAVDRGHEVANHTVYHPCSMERHRSRVRPNFSLEAYSPDRFEHELTTAEAELAEGLGGAFAHTFAYTCGEDWVGPDRRSVRPTVARLFPAARAVGGNGAIAPLAEAFAFEWVPSVMMDARASLRGLRVMLDEAVARRRWLVLTFHGVGGGHELDVPVPLHADLCRLLAERADDLVCDTFLGVATHLRGALHRPWTGAGGRAT